jgi:uncharacterized protein (TIGR02466 family)
MTSVFHFESPIDETTKVVNLWPTPVYKTNINRSLNYLEINFLNKNHKLAPLSENYRSDNERILDCKELADIKTFILNECNKYVLQVINPKDKIDTYLTQSWLSLTTKGQSHHPHYHSNSFLSGVFYYDVTDGEDSISFYNNSYSWNNRAMLHFDNNPTPWVSKKLSVPVKKGDLVIFPSYLDHGVDPKNFSTSVRKSLAFNTWLSGHMGTTNTLNENNFPKLL